MGLSYDEAIADLRQRSAAEPDLVAKIAMSLVDEEGLITLAYPSLSYVPGNPAVPVSTPSIIGDYLEGFIVAKTFLPPTGDVGQIDRNWDIRLDTGVVTRRPINRLPIIGAQSYPAALLWIRDRDVQGPTASIRMTRDGKFLRGVGRLPGGPAANVAFCALSFISVD
jgi:hypothetical protein